MENILYFIELDVDKQFVGYEKFIKLLSSEKQTQIHKFRFDIDKKLSLFSDLFVRYLACATMDLCNADLKFSKNAFGKPYLAGFSDFHYNISHTRNAFIIGISKKTIGVDIEKNNSADLKIAERFFSRNEVDYILANKDDQGKLFYEIWTKKEAYIKWLGKGLSMSLTSFDVMDVEINKLLITTQINDYVISACSEIRYREADIVKMDETQAAKMLTSFLFNTV